MSKLREAAQHALEALMDDCLVKVGPHSWERRSDLAITALKAALAEPVECPHGVTDGNCKECYEAKAESVQEPVAWMHTDPDKPRVTFLEWREDEPGYRGNWIKTPLYTAPQRCPNCASLEARNTELDRKLAELTTAVLRGNGIGGK